MILLLLEFQRRNGDSVDICPGRISKWTINQHEMFRFQFQVVLMCMNVQCAVIAAFTAAFMITLVAQWRLTWNAFVSGNSRRHTGNGSRGPHLRIRLNTTLKRYRVGSINRSYYCINTFPLKPTRLAFVLDIVLLKRELPLGRATGTGMGVVCVGTRWGCFHIVWTHVSVRD